ncbi:MAG: tripartite tricarboxylate transporter substrate binding protein [Betaproteobacteria bacterium]|nr:tripartite tricarboxylate transporter substrate binding protein [Betaproteobacteria bacterium]MBK6602896.1 tripartite tricarboxylate transporter substrate binding protein [Betaproteobacteria bacterium]MBK7080893.1 tripartite tricarboxylate transporter substrate binding protein [Betaproteobacteria bacterium]MBK7744024.1 tripartite tricarboxylate transporter substrate binding protein [Betaproteobacteria bacterium]MBK8687407.1 tripartite tricarboxylate transporter substrate binding protein [Bet
MPWYVRHPTHLEATAVKPIAANTSTRPQRRRTLLQLAALAGIAAMGAAPVALAQGAYPNKPVTLIVPYPAGGANDMLGRLIGQKLSEALGQQFIIENKPGAGTLIGTTAVAKAAPDGYTLLIGGLASFATSPVLFKADFDPVKDFVGIGIFGTAPTIAITYNEAPYKSLKDVVDAAKQKPGTIFYGSSGNGTALHLAGELFAIETKTDMKHVPYKGGSAHILDLIGGRLPVIFDTTTNATPLIKGGKVRALAIASATRTKELPDVPTYAEAGFPGSTGVTSWYGLFAPAATPKPVVEKLSAELAKVLKLPDVDAKLRSVGITPGTGDYREVVALIPAEYDKYSKLIKSLNIKAD